jgi:hypothetical protein
MQTTILSFAMLIFTGLIAAEGAEQQRALFSTFAQWEAFSSAAQDAYIAGALDAMLMGDDIDPYEKALNDRYSACLLRSRITPTQLRLTLLTRASKFPAMRSGAVLPFLQIILIEMCPDLLAPDVTYRLFERTHPLEPLPPSPARK